MPRNEALQQAVGRVFAENELAQAVVVVPVVPVSGESAIPEEKVVSRAKAVLSLVWATHGPGQAVFVASGPLTTRVVNATTTTQQSALMRWNGETCNVVADAVATPPSETRATLEPRLKACAQAEAAESVSYTHLTLPTN